MIRLPQKRFDSFTVEVVENFAKDDDSLLNSIDQVLNEILQIKEFRQYSVPQLKQVLKDFKIKGLTGLKKDDLITICVYGLIYAEIKKKSTKKSKDTKTSKKQNKNSKYIFNFNSTTNEFTATKENDPKTVIVYTINDIDDIKKLSPEFKKLGLNKLDDIFAILPLQYRYKFIQRYTYHTRRGFEIELYNISKKQYLLNIIKNNKSATLETNLKNLKFTSYITLTKLIIEKLSVLELTKLEAFYIIQLLDECNNDAVFGGVTEEELDALEDGIIAMEEKEKADKHKQTIQEIKDSSKKAAEEMKVKYDGAKQKRPPNPTFFDADDNESEEERPLKTKQERKRRPSPNHKKSKPKKQQALDDDTPLNFDRILGDPKFDFDMPENTLINYRTALESITVSTDKEGNTITSQPQYIPSGWLNFMSGIGGIFIQRGKKHKFPGYSFNFLKEYINAFLAFNKNSSDEAKDEFQFYPTPDVVASKAVVALDLQVGDVVLEPSAGSGCLIDTLLETGMSNTDIYACEANWRLIPVLNTKIPYENIIGKDALIITKKVLKDLGITKIIMNPPYANNRDKVHFVHFWHEMPENTHLVAIMPNGVGKRSKIAREYAKILEENPHDIIPLDSSPFKEMGTPINCHIVSIYK